MPSAVKIISLVPSQTELLYDLGLDKEVVGITKFCVHPDEWYHTKTRIGGTKNIDLNKIKSLLPTLIIANKEENVKEQIEALQEYTNVFVSDIKTIEDALAMILEIGKITKTSGKALLLAEKIKNNFDGLGTVQRYKAAYLIWRKPYMTVGKDTFINDMLKRIGFENVYKHKMRYPETDIAELKRLDPEIVLLSSEPYPFQKLHIEELQMQLPSAKIILVDGEMFSWYGSRMQYAPAYFLKILAEIENTQQPNI